MYMSVCVVSEGSFPNNWKSAIVNPLLKKPTLPKDDLSSYRPISNLSFVSKILEKVIHSRLCSHLDTFQSLPSFQSAYRKFHSTETALTKIHNDLSLAVNKRQVSALVLLDLSAAFDTINHSILIQRLQTVFGVTGSALSLLLSYLTDRSQSVLIRQARSSEISLSRGVPQGSVLGPLLFSLYTTPLSHILNASLIQYHMYADDTQLYISFSGSDSDHALASLSSVLDRLYNWFCENKLSINPSKTEYLLIGTPQQTSKVLDSSISFRDIKLTNTESARNLGVMFDSTLSFSSHISSVCRSAFFVIRQLRQLRSSLDFDSSVILANSIIHSKLDYCNSLFSGLPISSISRLQRVQNALARVVCLR